MNLNITFSETILQPVEVAVQKFNETSDFFHKVDVVKISDGIFGLKVDMRDLLTLWTRQLKKMDSEPLAAIQKIITLELGVMMHKFKPTDKNISLGLALREFGLIGSDDDKDDEIIASFEV